MSKLKLQTTHNQDITVISNQFIDQFMCDANGEFVKIYLYLLRCANDVPQDFSISFIADRINLTEKDVLRALKYWEKASLLTLARDEKNQVCSISLSESNTAPVSSTVKHQTTLYALPSASGKTETEASNKAFKTKSAESSNNFDMKFIDSSAYSPSDPDSLSSNDALRQLLFMTEQYFARPLNPSEILKIYYIYEILQFPIELIEYLIEHCISNGNKSMHYIEAVAVNWASEGIKTVAQAKENGSSYNKDYFTILNAFGIRNRHPVKSEIAYMEKWLHTYNFTIDIISEACSRTVSSIGSSSFPYADSILNAWSKSGIVMKKDIQALDADHKQKQTKKAPSGKVSDKNRFNNFEQRSYDYAELEKQLIQH